VTKGKMASLGNKVVRAENEEGSIVTLKILAGSENNLVILLWFFVF
jgi:hypothetical protein